MTWLLSGLWIVGQVVGSLVAIAFGAWCCYEFVYLGPRGQWRREIARDRARRRAKREEDAVRWLEGSHYRDAYMHAVAIRDAAQVNTHGYWKTRGVPFEREPMITAISAKMRIRERGIHPRLVRKAVDDVLEGRQPRW